MSLIRQVMIVALCVVGATGCGSVVVASRMNDALVAIEAARAADADQFAPYEYYLAKFYLYKSREKWGESQYEKSQEYAEEAKKSASIAKIKSMEDPWSGSPADPSLSPDDYQDFGEWNKMLGLEKK